MTDQSDTGNLTQWLDTNTVELAVKRPLYQSALSLENSILPSILFGRHTRPASRRGPIGGRAKVDRARRAWCSPKTLKP
eukprot:704050-Prorocentrum_minimum.AAC.1